MDDLEELLALAERLGAEAAALSLERLGAARDVRTKSTGTDMVTDVDEACERLIVDGIQAERPGDGVLSEEGATAEARSGVRWVIDPIDGTTNYLYGHPGYGISIAVEVDGETAVGVVHDPTARRTLRRRPRRRGAPQRGADPRLGPRATSARRWSRPGSATRPPSAPPRRSGAGAA